LVESGSIGHMNYLAKRDYKNLVFQEGEVGRTEIVAHPGNAFERFSLVHLRLAIVTLAVGLLLCSMLFVYEAREGQIFLKVR